MYVVGFCSITTVKLGALAHVWMFIVGPLAGGALAALCYNILFAKDGADESSKLD